MLSLYALKDEDKSFEVIGIGNSLLTFFSLNHDIFVFLLKALLHLVLNLIFIEFTYIKKQCPIQGSEQTIL